MDTYTTIQACTAPTNATFEVILDELCKLRSNLNCDLRGVSRGALNQDIYRATRRLGPVRDCVASLLKRDDTLVGDHMWLRLIAELGAQIEFQCFTALGAPTKELAMRSAFRGYGIADHAIDHARHLCEQSREGAAA